MKVTVHKKRGCPLCARCLKLLEHWGIPFTSEYDSPTRDKPYPYITLEINHEELVDLISKEVF